jgi:formiminotetrahydrofolate cyclodeaminase
MKLVWLPGDFAIVRLAPDEVPPAWGSRGPLHSITRTRDELSIVCAAEDVPDGLVAERGWRCLRVAGRLDLSLTGILDSIAGPLARSGVAVFAISTYDTDYVLVPGQLADVAAASLRRAGHVVAEPASPAYARLPRQGSMMLLDLTTRELLDRLASSEPTPGGGSAAALSGALGAALVAMVASMERTRTGAAQERERLDTALGWAREAGGRLRALVDEDTRAYDAVIAAYRLPKGGDDEKAERKAAIATALARATDVPLQSAEACLVVLKAAQEAAVHGNPNALSDARTGGALAYAGLTGAAENVRINLGPTDQGSDLRTRLEAIVKEGRTWATTLGLI